MKKVNFFGRETELDQLKTYAQSKGSGFVYLRGRRRIGKSSLLKKFQQTHSDCFYFMGTPDSTNAQIRSEFAQQWSQFSQNNRLNETKDELLTWKRLFSDVTEYAQNGERPLVIIFDEIQWICKKLSGFAGRLKEAWLDWEQTGCIKVIVCGSSNKFFKSYAEGAEKVLRGIRTRADIWVVPFTLKEVERFYFPRWHKEEIALTYMMLGGCPYYLERVNPKSGFVLGINDAIFTKTSIFIDEINEILRLDFNERGTETVKKILSVLGQDGSTQQGVVEKTGLPQSVVADTIEKLLSYEIIFEKKNVGQKSKLKARGTKSVMKDFYLNFYFQVIEPLAQRIRDNEKGNLFGTKCLLSKLGYYIPEFSGKAYELLVSTVMENRHNMTPKIFEALDLRDVDYEVGTFQDRQSQIDIVIQNKHDRKARLIECKWMDGQNLSREALVNLSEKKFTPPKGFSCASYLVASQKLTQGLLSLAHELHIQCISLEDLW